MLGCVIDEITSGGSRAPKSPAGPRPSKSGYEMTTHTITELHELRPAIARSISHDEIVRCKLDGITRDEALAYLDECEGVTDLDSVVTDDSQAQRRMIDCWGQADSRYSRGGDFRLYLVGHSSELPSQLRREANDVCGCMLDDCPVEGDMLTKLRWIRANGLGRGTDGEIDAASLDRLIAKVLAA